MLALLHLAQALVERDRHPIDRQARQRELRLDLLGDLLAQRDGVAVGGARIVRERERARIGEIAEA